MNMLSSAEAWDTVASGYAEVTMVMFQGYVEKALEFVPLTKDSEIIDIACGPGTLTLIAAAQAASVTSVDFSENMIAILQDTIEREAITNVEACHGDGQDLPFENGRFDAAFSMFGLMFFPDRMKGYREMHRTLKPGGTACISSWAPVSDSPLMASLFGALRAIKPDLPEPSSDVESLENPDFFKQEMETAGFKDVVVHRVTNNLTVGNATEFWDGMVKGSAPVTMMKNSMPEDAWQEKCRIAIAHLDKTLGTYPATLTADAWIATGIK